MNKNKTPDRILWKIVFGAILLFLGSWMAIQGYPSPIPVVLASHTSGSLTPGGALVQQALPWEIFVQYFRLLLFCLLFVHAGSLYLYAGWKPSPPTP